MNQQVSPPNQININLHQQRLIALIIAGVTLIFMFLSWWTKTAPGVQLENPKGNGFGDFGLLTAAGILGVMAATFMGQKHMPYEKQPRMIALISFAAIALGAIAHAILVATQGGKQIFTHNFQQYEINVTAATGIGTWLALATGLIGLAYVSGILNQFISPKMNQPTGYAPPPQQYPPTLPTQQYPPAPPPQQYPPTPPPTQQPPQGPPPLV